MSRPYRDEVATFRQKLKASPNISSAAVAKETAELLRRVLSGVARSDVLSLLTLLRQTAKEASEEQVHATVITNICRRFLYILREEHENTTAVTPVAASTSSDDSPPGFSRTLSTINPEPTALMPTAALRDRCPRDTVWGGQWKNSALRHITEYVEELQGSTEMICDYANHHINDGAVILTYGRSHIVEKVLIASKRKRIEVLVAEDAPSLRGRQLAQTLAQAGLTVTLIPDAAVFAIMSRVSEVMVGTRAVLANGGLVTTSGVHAVAVAAKAHSVPFVVCTALFKITPVFPYDVASQFSNHGSPADVLPYEFLVDTACHGGVNQLHVNNPSSDYIPPDLVHTYITNTGTQSPSYIYRLLAEMYNPDDNSFE